MAPRRVPAGFTLLEMMLSLVLLAVGTVALIEAFQRGQAGATDGENVLIATFLVQRCQETLRNVAYASLASQANTACTIPSGAAFSRFTRTVTVTPLTSVAPYNTSRLTQLDVLIAWPAAGSAGSTNVTLSTMRSAD